MSSKKRKEREAATGSGIPSEPAESSRTQEATGEREREGDERVEPGGEEESDVRQGGRESSGTGGKSKSEKKKEKKVRQRERKKEMEDQTSSIPDPSSASTSKIKAHPNASHEQAPPSEIVLGRETFYDPSSIPSPAWKPNDGPPPRPTTYSVGDFNPFSLPNPNPDSSDLGYELLGIHEAGGEEQRDEGGFAQRLEEMAESGRAKDDEDERPSKETLPDYCLSTPSIPALIPVPAGADANAKRAHHVEHNLQPRFLSQYRARFGTTKDETERLWNRLSYYLQHHDNDTVELLTVIPFSLDPAFLISQSSLVHFSLDDQKDCNSCVYAQVKRLRPVPLEKWISKHPRRVNSVSRGKEMVQRTRGGHVCVHEGETAQASEDAARVMGTGGGPSTYRIGALSDAEKRMRLQKKSGEGFDATEKGALVEVVGLGSPGVQYEYYRLFDGKRAWEERSLASSHRPPAAPSHPASTEPLLPPPLDRSSSSISVDEWPSLRSSSLGLPSTAESLSLASPSVVPPLPSTSVAEPASLLAATQGSAPPPADSSTPPPLSSTREPTGKEMQELLGELERFALCLLGGPLNSNVRPTGTKGAYSPTPPAVLLAALSSTGARFLSHSLSSKKLVLRKPVAMLVQAQSPGVHDGTTKGIDSRPMVEGTVRSIVGRGMSDEEWELGSKQELTGSPAPWLVGTSPRSPDRPSIASSDISSPDPNRIPSGSSSLVISHRAIRRVLTRRDDLERGEEDDNDDGLEDDEEGEESEDEEEEVTEYADGEEDDKGASLELDDWLHQDPEKAYGVLIPSHPKDLRVLCLRLHESTGTLLSSADMDVMVGEMWATLEAFGIVHLFVRETHHLLVVRPVTSLASSNHLAHPRKAERDLVERLTLALTFVHAHGDAPVEMIDTHLAIFRRHPLVRSIIEPFPPSVRQRLTFEQEVGVRRALREEGIKHVDELALRVLVKGGYKGGSIESFVAQRKNTPTLLITGGYGQAFSAWVGRRNGKERRTFSRDVVALVFDERKGVLESARLGWRTRSKPSLHSPVLCAEWEIHNSSGAFAQVEGSSIRCQLVRDDRGYSAIQAVEDGQFLEWTEDGVYRLPISEEAAGRLGAFRKIDDPFLGLDVGEEVDGCWTRTDSLRLPLDPEEDEVWEGSWLD